MKQVGIIQFWLFLFFCSYLSLTPAPPQVMQAVSDKLLHSVGYLTLYLSCTIAYGHASQANKKLLFLLGHSIMIEVFQHFIPNREFSLLDILANAIGLLCGLVLVRIFGKRFAI